MRQAEIIRKGVLEFVYDLTGRDEQGSEHFAEALEPLYWQVSPLLRELADSGKKVALVCGGDPGIYAMAGLVYELVKETGSASKIEIIPGIAALNSCAAILGAPLMHDFAAISLSDLMTPWQVIEKRLQAAAMADFVTVIYNPKSKKRTSQIVRAREIMLEHRNPNTPVGIVSGATRTHETVCLTSLDNMLDEEIGMQSTVIIGNTTTFVFQDKMITPRGYTDKYGLASKNK